MVRLQQEHIESFTFAGNAIITLESACSKKHYTYKIKRSEDKPELYFIHLLRGPDNENDYRYMACYYRDTSYLHPCKTYQQVPRRNWPLSLQAVSYFLEHIHKVPDRLYVYHEGKCARCGRKLTTPESIESGFGPECIKFI